MAPNKFATHLHKNTHKTAMILVYTFLEWTLIALLLLNALFSFLIAKFADFFGLHPPCFLCSNISGTGFRDTICAKHAAEMSTMTFCSRHKQLGGAADMCEDCLLSRPVVLEWMKRSECGEKDLRCSCCGVALESGFLELLEPSWGVGEMDQKAEIEEEVVDVLDEGGVVEVMMADDGNLQVVNCLSEAFDGEERRLVPVELIDSTTMMGELVVDQCVREGDAGVECDIVEGDIFEPVVEVMDMGIDVGKRDAATMTESTVELVELVYGHLEREELMVEVVDTRSKKDVHTMTDNHVSPRSVGEEDRVLGVDHLESDCAESIVNLMDMGYDNVAEMTVIVEDRRPLLLAEESVGSCSVYHRVVEDAVVHEIIEDVLDAEAVEPVVGGDSVAEDHPALPLAEDGEESVERCSVDHRVVEDAVVHEIIEDVPDAEAVEPVVGGDSVAEDHPALPLAEESVGSCSVNHRVVEDAVVHEIIEDVLDADAVETVVGGVSGEIQGVTSEFESRIMDTVSNCEISIGSEICDEEQIDQSHVEQLPSMTIAMEGECSEECTESTDKCEVTETEMADTIGNGPTGVDLSSLSQERNEVERERTPDTPSSVDGMHAMHKRFYFERRESGTESLDGSVASEMETSETLTADRLKAALNAERKALSALYAELEEERSASAIAANQTMAMITRLQQEKSEMQMEALQYQRMMEEQSEYDQEALQLLNELMMKREKEKQDLEHELDVYRSKIHHYEAKEKKNSAMSNGHGGNATSSPSSSGDDRDDISFDCHDGDDCFNSLKESNQRTPTGVILRSRELPEDTKNLHTLDESLADFEEERASLLEHLKELEEKLFTLDDDESSKNLENMDHFSENGHSSLYATYNSIKNGFSDHLDTKGRLFSAERSTGYRGKRLLPLFDATNTPNGDVLHTNSDEPNASEYVSKSELDDEKLAIVEEVETVYERLRALEADREFLKYCLSSLKKGGKGGLLQEILQHLQDLREVELQAMNADSD